MMGYVLSEDSTVSAVEVDDKTVTKEGHGDPVDLTQDQVDRANAIDGVELVEAGSAPRAEESEASSPQQEVHE